MRRNRDGEQSCCRLFGRFSFLLIAGVLSLYAQTFAHFKTKQIAEFKHYKDVNDKAFATYLRSQWQAYKKFSGSVLYKIPKPARIPKTKLKPSPKVGPKVYIKLPQSLQTKKAQLPPMIVINSSLNKREKEESSYDVIVDFFGTKMGFDIPQKLKSAKFYPTSQQGIVNYFDAAATSDYDVLLKEIESIKNSMQLNDWGLYLLVDAIAHKLYRYEDEAQLFDWFVFNKLGYDVKIGLANGRAVALYNSKKVIYSIPNYRFGIKRYYLLSSRGKKGVGMIYSYAQNYSKNTKAFDLTLDTLPILQPDYQTKQLQFVYFGTKYTLSFKYNKNLIDFFATYPQADYATFFNAPVDEITFTSLVASLRRYINAKRAAEAMNFVLHFVQNAFAYETDKKQFGHEKVMFAEETLFYSASDCEDRAVLYAALIKKLFNVSIAAIKYPNHMATALHVPLEGQTVEIDGREFVIADPTYINANIGEVMPQFKGKKPESFILVGLKR